MPTDIINKFNKRELTNTFILYMFEESQTSSKSICNLNCVHCYYRFVKGELKPIEDMKKEIDIMIGKGSDHIQITGGEPTIHPDFIELLRYVKSKNVMCSIITNGLMLSDEKFLEKAKPFVDYFLMSLHAGTEKTCNIITQKETSWEKIMKALDNLEKNEIEVHINFTAMKPNYKELPILIDIIGKKKNIARINIITFNPWISFQDEKGKKEGIELIESYSEMMPYIEEAYEKAKEYGIDMALRYFPFCVLSEKLRKFNFNYTTSIFDMNEWDREMWFPKYFKDISYYYELSEKFEFEGSLKQRLQHSFSRFFPAFREHFANPMQCLNCSHFFICDLPHKEQVDLFPEQEFDAIEGEHIKDAGYYFKRK